jgi:hypothetical protein
MDDGSSITGAGTESVNSRLMIAAAFGSLMAIRVLEAKVTKMDKSLGAIGSHPSLE